MIGIYKITSPSNKIYIGQTTNYITRCKNYRLLRCENQTKLYPSLLKQLSGIQKNNTSLIYQ